ncbi:MAG: hypothetical protein NXH73_00900 [Flavobacteriaceae bacterium]|nr:hypothetical protein [Flavobacteriaceae bacterium]
MKLLTSQKDEIYALINEFDGFHPTQFQINEFPANRTITFGFKNSIYFFQFNYSKEGDVYLKYSPGFEKYEESTGYLSWGEIVLRFDDWLVNLKREITTPDYWGNLKKQISGITFINQIDNEKFTFSEYEDLEGRLESLKSHLNTIPLLKEQHTEIINHLDKLSQQAKDLGKFDWGNLFIGTMIAVFIQLAVSQENISALWELIKSTFSNYFLE